MTNLHKVVTQGIPTTTAFTSFVGHPGEITVNTATSQATIHNGSTPGGNPLGGGFAVAGPFTAHSGDSISGAPILTANAVNIVTVVNTNYDSVALPPAIAGTIVTVMMPWGSGANILSIWPSGTDTLNNIPNDPVDYQSANAGFVPNPFAYFVCLTNGAWYSNVPSD